MATLVRTQGSHEGKWVYPVGSRCILGRHKDCDISDIFADNSNVSRFHAQVEWVNGHYFVEDRGSRNGTFLNDQRLTGRTRIRNNDRLGIAGVELTFFEETENRKPTPALSLSECSDVSIAESSASQKPLSSLAVLAQAASGPLPGYTGEKLRALVQMLKRLGRSLEIETTLLRGPGQPALDNGGTGGTAARSSAALFSRSADQILVDLPILHDDDEVFAWVGDQLDVFDGIAINQQ